MLGRAEFEEFLDDVITEDVGHEAVSGGYDLRKDELFFGDRSSFQLLLDETRAVLVLRELDDVVLNIA